MNFLDPNDKHFYYGNMKELAAVAIPFTQYLAERYGGKWKHHKASGSWNCNDNIRYIREVRVGFYDTNDEGWAGTANRYLYYKDGRPTEIV
jgi:hypothetical protein